MTIVACSTAWTDERIAALSAAEIARMNYDEMLALVDSRAQTTERPSVARVTESEVLVRLVYALRQRCRNELACG